jgi:hypothetical protein
MTTHDAEFLAAAELKRIRKNLKRLHCKAKGGFRQ